jgi:succinoglycan biosynthesis transport protein ExoP
MTELRNKYLKVSKRAPTDDAGRPNHETVTLLKNECGSMKKQIFDELGRIAETLSQRSADCTLSRRVVVPKLSNLMGVNAADNRTLVPLREKERVAESLRTLYQSFLQRYQEMTATASFRSLRRASSHGRRARCVPASRQSS